MKKYILMQAMTGSEWDSVEFALVELTDSLLSQIKKMKLLFDLSIVKESGIQYMSVPADNAEFFIDASQLPDSIKTNGYNGDEIHQQIIELENIEEFERPEQTLKYGEMKFYCEALTFTATGKHTDEEFWCDVRYNTIFENELQTSK